MAGQTKPLSITGGKLLVTADTDTLRAGGENTNFLKNVGKLTVSVEVAGVSGLLPCTSLVGQNVTNAALEGCDPLGSRIRSILLEFIPVRGGGAVGLLAFEKRSLLKYTKIEQKLGSFCGLTITTRRLFSSEGGSSKPVSESRRPHGTRRQAGHAAHPRRRLRAALHAWLWQLARPRRRRGL